MYIMNTACTAVDKNNRYATRVREYLKTGVTYLAFNMLQKSERNC